MARRAFLLIFSGSFLLLLAGLLALPLIPAIPDGFLWMDAAAGPLRQEEEEEAQDVSSETCLACHDNPDLNLTLENGEVLSLYVPGAVYAQSVHAEQGVTCIQCHEMVGNFPHPPFSAADTRDVTLQFYPVCQDCHAEQFTLVQDSVHADALAAGNRNAAVCSDCHPPHSLQRLTAPEGDELLPEARQKVPQTCATCHFAIFRIYANSVHGEALLQEGNPDVPTCTSCHGVHSIDDPTTAAFRLQSPQICAGCHTDPELMAPYGLSTQVLDTYVADFHGTTVTLFERQHPDQDVNQPVCYDCHGVHNIQSISDPEEGLAIRENLLARCQVCHPNASENFPAAWLSHYVPSPERHPLVFSVNLFYQFFIPAVLGGMAVLVFMDAGAALRRRVFGRRREAVEEPPVQPRPGGARAFDIPPAGADPEAGREPPAAAEEAPEEVGPETPTEPEVPPADEDEPLPPEGRRPDAPPPEGPSEE